MSQDLIRLATVVLGSALAVWSRRCARGSRRPSACSTSCSSTPRRPRAARPRPAYVASTTGSPRSTASGPRPPGPHDRRDTPDLPAEVARGRGARAGRARRWSRSTSAAARPRGPASRASSSPRTGRSCRPATTSWCRARRHRGDGAAPGVRALREQTDRYEALWSRSPTPARASSCSSATAAAFYANAAFEQLCGYAFPELAAMDTLLGLVVEYDVEIRRRALQAIEAGWSAGQALTMPRRDGGWVDSRSGGTPLEVERRRQLVVVVRDVTARRRPSGSATAARPRRAAGRGERAVRPVARRGADDAQHRPAVRPRDRRDVRDPARRGARARPRRPARGRCGLRDQERERELLAALEVGRARLDDRGRAQRRRARGERRRDRPAPPHAAACTACSPPASTVLARERGGGAARAVRGTRPPRRAAIENARLYAERDTRRARSSAPLLPAELPAIPGVEIAARYSRRRRQSRSAATSTTLPRSESSTGRWSSETSRARAPRPRPLPRSRATRCARSRPTRHPSAALGQLNEALLRDRVDYRFCTVVYATLIPREDRVSVCVSAGGHPLPLVLRAGGGVETVGSPGTLLGIVDDPAARRAVGRARARRRAVALYRRGDRGRPPTPRRAGWRPFSPAARARTRLRSPKPWSATRSRPRVGTRGTTSRSLRCAPTAARWCRLSPRAMG